MLGEIWLYQRRLSLSQGGLRLVREDGNKFNDHELAAVLQAACENGASAFRPRGTADVLGVLDMSAMERARTWNVCAFNKFREVLGLAREYLISHLFESRK